MYLDHVSVGGSAEDVLHDLDVIKAAEELGLFFNNKSVVMHSVRGTIITALPGALVVDPERTCLLGSPLGDVGSTTLTWTRRYRL